MKKYLTILIIALVWLGITTRAFCYQADVTDISGAKYFPAVKEALSNAKESIYMAMYFVSFDPQEKASAVSGLVEELVNAHKRGVKVKVILDQNVNFDAWEEAKGGWEKEIKNSTLFAYLKKQGIEVYYDSLYVITHAKSIVIDEETTILGSANWSSSSLNKNWEVSCLIKSKDLAKEFLDDFSKITIDLQAGAPEEEQTSGMRLANSFLKDPSLAARMLTYNDERAFNLYLLLLKTFDGNPEGRIDINYEELIPALGLDEKLSYYRAQQSLQEAFRRLDEKYHLIQRIRRPPQIKYIILLDYPNKTPYILPKEKYFSIPNEYWQYGWYKTLPSAEKFCYLINLYKAGLSHRSYWSDYIIGLSRGLHVARGTITRGMQGLRKLNIIEMEYPAYVWESGKPEPRGPTYFHLRGLYSPEVSFLMLGKNRVRS